MATTEDFLAWLQRDLRRAGGIKKAVEIILQPIDSSLRPVGVRLCIYTDTNRYAITATDPVPAGAREDQPAQSGYLGCIATNRKSRAGEEWHRGNDLADGPLEESTWRTILADIVAYEVVRVHRATDADRQQPPVPFTESAANVRPGNGGPGLIASPEMP